MRLTQFFFAASLLLVASAASAQIGVTYLQATRLLESDFDLKGIKSDPAKGKIVGQSKDGIAVIELIGDLNNLTSASLTIAVPNDSTTARARNSARLLRFVANTVPEWKGNTRWINSRLQKIADGDYSNSTTTVGLKKITLMSAKEGAIILTLVEKK